MTLETATFIQDLVPSNPSHTDPLSQADSHTRLIKSTLQNTFPNFTDVALASTQAQLDAAVAVTSGTAVNPFPLGTAALPGLTPFGDPDTGLWSPAANQLALSLTGSQVLLMGGSALITSLAFAAPAIATTGAFSGGTGQLVSIGATMIWWDDVLPVEGGYTWANGVPISRTACPILFARWGTKYGIGDGSTTFGVPNLCETSPVGKSTMGGIAARGLLTSITTALITSVGSLFGAQTNTLATANLPPYTPSGSITNGAISISQNAAANSGGSGTGGGSYPVNAVGYASISASQAGSSFNGAAQGGTSAPVPNVQPSTTCNYIIRVG